MYTYGCFMLMYGRNQHNTVIILQLRINKEKKLVEIPAAKKITTVNMLVVHPSGLFIIGFLTSHLFLLI